MRHNNTMPFAIAWFYRGGNPATVRYNGMQRAMKRMQKHVAYQANGLNGERAVTRRFCQQAQRIVP